MSQHRIGNALCWARSWFKKTDGPAGGEEEWQEEWFAREVNIALESEVLPGISQLITYDEGFAQPQSSRRRICGEWHVC